jgi:protein TonB
VERPTLLVKVEPAYSEEARVLGHQGKVVLKVVISAEGRAEAIQVLEPIGLGLDEEAVRAVRQWRFAPGRKGGVPVAVKAVIEVNFRLS